MLDRCNFCRMNESVSVQGLFSSWWYWVFEYLVSILTLLANVLFLRKVWFDWSSCRIWHHGIREADGGSGGDSLAGQESIVQAASNLTEMDGGEITDSETEVALAVEGVLGENSSSYWRHRCMPCRQRESERWKWKQASHSALTSVVPMLWHGGDSPV